MSIRKSVKENETSKIVQLFAVVTALADLGDATALVRRFSQCCWEVFAESYWNSMKCSAY